jgi:hypothetical protein
MCDNQVSSFQRILHSVATRELKIRVQRVEEIFPALKENMVSPLCLDPQKRIILFPVFEWLVN